MTENGSIPISDGSGQNGARASQTDAERGAGPASRRPQGDRPHEFTLSAWLLEGMVGLCDGLQRNEFGLPQAFWTHAYAARREALLAARTLIDAALARCEADAARQNEETDNRRGRIEID